MAVAHPVQPPVAVPGSGGHRGRDRRGRVGVHMADDEPEPEDADDASLSGGQKLEGKMKAVLKDHCAAHTLHTFGASVCFTLS